jgi:Tol biopolymer transport system component
LSHPNILALHVFAREGDVSYAVMELLEGETLRDALASGPLTVRRATDYAVQIALGLAAAHEKGIVHRDLKPDNLFITRDERVKILDFGLAKAGAVAADTESQTQSPTVSGYTEPGAVMGTVGYMSPEQVRGFAVDHRSDIFSFGSVLYEMLTGERAFQRETVAETMTAILKEDAAEQDVPASMAPVVRHCLEKKPERRFQSAKDLAFALETASAPTGSAPLLATPTRPRFSAAKPLGLAALVAGSVVAGYLLHRSPNTAQLSDGKNLTLTLLTTDPGYEGEPTFSPDGQTIAYVADRDGNFEIYLQQISGGPAINLTHDPAADIQPAFSPDGREIAFVSDRADGTEIFHSAPGLPHVGGDIWVMPTLGGPPRRIVENGSFPSWTPDGTGIVYVHGGFRHTRIAIVPSTGGVARDVPIEDLFVSRYYFPRLSQDGRWLLYQNGYQIEVVSAQGGKPKILAQGEYAAWGAGSTSIIYTNGVPGKSRALWTAPFSTTRGELSGSPRPLTFGIGADIGAAVSRDGRVIAFSAVNETLNLEEVSFDPDGGKVLGAERQLTAGNNRIRFFDTSPDGKTIIYDAERGAGSHLWRLDPPAPPIELTREPGISDSNPTWSPDGRQIAFSREPIGTMGGSFQLLLMNADGTNVRRVAEMEGAGFSVWVPDGKKILVPRGDLLVQLDLESGKTVPVPGVDARNLFILDRSGQWIVFQTAQSGGLCLSAVPVTGGTPRVVVDATHEPFHPFFSPSGRWLYFQRNHKNIFRVPGPAQDWKSAPPEKVTDFSGTDLYIEDPKLSRDGSKLFFTRGRTTGDIVILRMSGLSDRKTAN